MSFEFSVRRSDDGALVVNRGDEVFATFEGGDWNLAFLMFAAGLRSLAPEASLWDENLACFHLCAGEMGEDLKTRTNRLLADLRSGHGPGGPRC